MQDIHSHVSSDRSREHFNRRQKRRDEAGSELPNSLSARCSRRHGEIQARGYESHDDPLDHSCSRYVEDYRPSMVQLDDSFDSESPARHCGENQHGSSQLNSRSRHPVKDNNYVNTSRASYARHHEQYYDGECSGQVGFEGTHNESDEAFQFDYPCSRNSGSHPSREHRTSRGEPFFPTNDTEPSALSVSECGQGSISTTPRGFGGNEREFWNPQPELDGAIPVNPPQLQHTTGLQKFLASFRRLKRARQSADAVASTEPNVSIVGSVLARVVLLDGEEVSYQVARNETGQSLLTKVCQTADIVEADYFGLTYLNRKLHTWFWLDADKKISKQLQNGEQWLFSFQVKFYPPEPTLLHEDITRYQLTLQVRQDIYTGKLPCSWVTQALLGSFMVQAELGDYDEREHGTSVEYLKEFEFVPSPTPQLLLKIAELHKTHVGMKPGQADIKYLETAKRLELYGVDLHPVRDMENVDIYLGVGFHGIVIYRDRLRIGRFAWPKVLRISYKRNNFFLKIRPDHSEPVETVIGFRLLNHHLANRLWKAAVEHHSFFRLKETRAPKVASTSFKSHSAHTGHTFFQYRTMNINRPHPQFDRSLAKRRTFSMPTGLNKAPSMHSLSRAHPRNMTLGRAQNSDTVVSQHSTLREKPLFNAGHTSSASQLEVVSQPSSQSQSGRHIGGAVEHSLSYESSRRCCTPGSQSHDYINQRSDPADLLANKSALTASMISGYSDQRSQVESHHRRHYVFPRADSFPPETGRPSTSRAYAGGVSQQAKENSPEGRKPPVGGVPVLGGVLIMGSSLTRRDQRSVNRSGSTIQGKQCTNVGLYPEVDEDYWDTPLEYDDDEFERTGSHQTDALAHYQLPSHGPPKQPFTAQYNRRGDRENVISVHTPSRSEPVELML